MGTLIESSSKMSRHLYCGLGLLMFCLIALAAPAVLNALEGTVKKIDAATRTVVVKTTKGAEHTFRFVPQSAGYGTEKTAKGTEATAEEVDDIGKGD